MSLYHWDTGFMRIAHYIVASKTSFFNVQNPENVRFFFLFFKGYPLLEPYFSIIIGFKRKVASVETILERPRCMVSGRYADKTSPGSATSYTAFSVLYRNIAPSQSYYHCLYNDIGFCARKILAEFDSNTMS